METTFNFKRTSELTEAAQALFGDMEFRAEWIDRDAPDEEITAWIVKDAGNAKNARAHYVKSANLGRQKALKDVANVAAERVNLPEGDENKLTPEAARQLLVDTFATTPTVKLREDGATTRKADPAAAAKAAREDERKALFGNMITMLDDAKGAVRTRIREMIGEQFPEFADQIPA